jgi:hypothetical protein
MSATVGFRALKPEELELIAGRLWNHDHRGRLC